MFLVEFFEEIQVRPSLQFIEVNKDTYVLKGYSRSML